MCYIKKLIANWIHLAWHIFTFSTCKTTLPFIGCAHKVSTDTCCQNQLHASSCSQYCLVDRLASWFAEPRRVSSALSWVTRWTPNLTNSSCALCSRRFWHWFSLYGGGRSWHSVSFTSFWSLSKHQLTQDPPHQRLPSWS